MTGITTTVLSLVSLVALACTPSQSDQSVASEDTLDGGSTTSSAQLDLTCSNPTSLPTGGSDIAVGADGVWLVGGPMRGGASLALLEGTATRAVATVGIAPTALATGGGAIWVLNGSGLGPIYGGGASGPGYPSENSLQRIHPESGEVIDQIPVNNPSDVGFGHGYVWVSADKGLLRIDPELPLSEFSELTVENLGAGRLAFSESAIWVVSDDQAKVIRIIPDTMDATLTSLEERGSAAGRGRAVWFFSDSGLHSVHEETLIEIDRIDGPFAYGLATSPAGIWVADTESRAHLFASIKLTHFEPCQLPEPPVAAVAQDETAWFMGENSITRVAPTR